MTWASRDTGLTRPIRGVAVNSDVVGERTTRSVIPGSTGVGLVDELSLDGRPERQRQVQLRAFDVGQHLEVPGGEGSWGLFDVVGDRQSGDRISGVELAGRGQDR